MKFTKMHGIGNDYVYVNCFEESIKNPAEVSKFVSDRHFGIGSDGLILISPSAKADFRMNIYNADGSQAEMCGNGIRCVAKYVYDYGLTDKTEISVETLAGIKYLRLQVENGKVASVEVNMGAPILEPKEIPVAVEESPVVNVPVEVKGKIYHMTCVSMGNPHAIIFMNNVKDLDIAAIGPYFENHTVFPKRTNTEFVEVKNDKYVRMRVWERGAGITWACGTGSCATLVACVLNKRTQRTAQIELDGGILTIQWADNNRIYMTGPATKVFTATWAE